MVLLIPFCVGLNAVITLHLAPCWRKRGSTYASSPLQSDSCSWWVFVEEVPWFLQETPGLPSLPTAKVPEDTPEWIDVIRDTECKTISKVILFLLAFWGDAVLCCICIDLWQQGHPVMPGHMSYFHWLTFICIHFLLHICRCSILLKKNGEWNAL